MTSQLPTPDRFQNSQNLESSHPEKAKFRIPKVDPSKTIPYRQDGADPIWPFLRKQVDESVVQHTQENSRQEIEQELKTAILQEHLRQMRLQMRLKSWFLVVSSGLLVISGLAVIFQRFLFVVAK
ncbi:hypothetical protein [Spirulina sp. 06S082]|uniref:hypothetical protein n=1 Tax=Spirulina sp. 06S082 TaxID=3110248 RepID=UPI002B1ED365|nr:hypothetical protein [Spirulina sp. 06S082]MEA5471359.1 hypothetical protein [Spirulina sp. 06S082]